MMKKILYKSIYAIPFLLGFYGFMCLEDMSLSDSVFNSIGMYLMNYDDSPANIFVDLARWTAPLATASCIILAFNQLKSAIINKIRYFLGGSIAVYGDPKSKEILLSQLKHKGISGDRNFIAADNYIFSGTEEENLSLYTAFQDKIRCVPVYLRSRSLGAGLADAANVKLWSPEELSARLFWKQNFLYPLFRKNGHSLTIVIVGFGELGEELLLWGLQNLIFDPEQKITYHIFGDGSQFSAMHPQLSEISDTVCFHKEAWFEKVDLCDRADLFIVAEQENQTKLVSDLLSLSTQEEIHVFTENSACLDLLDGKERLNLFNWMQEAMKVENILDGKLLDRAKAINLRYAHLYSGVEETPAHLEAEWAKLNSFTRYSNISAADYHEIRLKMLEEMKSGPENADTMELLSQLEHIRWCRYHYLNNWSQGVPENGKSKDPAKRIHLLLVPYEDLSNEEKEKDKENIRVLMSI